MGVVIELERRPVVLELTRRPWVIEKGVGRVGPKGNPGGNVESIGLLDDLPDLVIPAGTERISTTGIDTLGNDPATFIQTAEGGPATWRKRQSADGRWFARHFENRSMPIEATGAKTSRYNNHLYLREAAAWISAQGGGRMVVTPGDWIGEGRIDVPDGVLFQGFGGRSKLINTKTDGNVNDRIVLQFGNYPASSTANLSFTDETLFACDDAVNGQPYVLVPSSGDAASIPIGAKVALFAGASATGANWRDFMQLNWVVDVDAGDRKVFLAYPLGEDAAGLSMTVLETAGLDGMGDEDPPAYCARGAGAIHLGLHSDGYKALGFSGAIECHVEDIYNHRSLRLFSGSGWGSGSVAKNIRGFCTEQTLNTAWFSSDSVVEDIHGTWDGRTGSGTNVGWLMEENVQRVQYRNITIDAGLSVDMKDAVKISKCARGNTCEGLTHRSGHAEPSLWQRAYTQAGMTGGGNVFHTSLGEYPNATKGSHVNSTLTDLALAPAKRPDLLKGVELRAPNLNSGERTFVFNGSAGIWISDVKTDRGGVTIAAGATSHRLEGWTITEDAMGAVTDNAGDFYLTGVVRGRVPKARARARRLTNLAGISDTSTAYQVPGFASTFPVGSLQTGDVIRVRAGGTWTGPAGTRHVVLTLNGTEVARLDAGNTDNKGWSLDSEIIIRSSTSQRIETNYTNETAVDPSYESTTINIGTTDVVLDMLAYVAVGTDAVVFTKVTSDVDIQYAA